MHICKRSENKSYEVKGSAVTYNIVEQRHIDTAGTKIDTVQSLSTQTNKPTMIVKSNSNTNPWTIMAYGVALAIVSVSQLHVCSPGTWNPP